MGEYKKRFLGPFTSICSGTYLADRSAVAMAEDTVQWALQCAMLGYQGQSNQILELLFEFAMLQLCRDLTAFHHAWSETGNWPSFFDMTKEASQSERVQELTGFSSTDTSGCGPSAILQIKKDGDEAISGQNEYQENVHGLKRAMADFEKLNTQEFKESESKLPIMFRRGGEMKPLAAAIHIALALGRHETVEDLLRILAEKSNSPSLKCITDSSRIWKILAKGWLAEQLKINEDEVKSQSKHVQDIIRKRLTDGPQRPLKDLTTEQLLEIIEENQRTCPDEDVLGDQAERRSEGVRKEPAKRSAIIAAEKLLGVNFPDDYKDFFRISNGLKGHVKISVNRLMGPVESVSKPNSDILELSQVPVVDMTSFWIGHMLDLDWPPLDEDCLCLSHLHLEPMMYIASPEVLQRARNSLQEAYASANTGQRKMVDRAVVDHYGSWEHLDALKTLYLWQGWFDEPLQPWPSLLAFLENLALRTKHWEHSLD